MNWNIFKRKKKKSKEEFVDILLEYIGEAKRLNWSDEKIKRKFMEKGYSEELINLVFQINNLKGGKMVKQKMVKKEYNEEDFEDSNEEETEEEPEEEEEETEEEPEEQKRFPKIKKEVKKEIRTEVKKTKIGAIRVVPQTVSYQVLDGYDENDEEIWIPCETYPIAKILSNSYKE